MMIAFRDDDWNLGVVTDNVTLMYKGRGRRRVSTFLERLEGECREDDGTIDIDAFVQEVMLELPVETPITEVRRLR